MFILPVYFRRSVLGCVEIRRGNYALARTLAEESLTLFRSIDDRPLIALVLGHLALTADKLEDTAQAIAWSEESLEMHRELGDHLVVATTLGNMGLIMERLGDLERARSLHMQSLAIHRDLGNRYGMAGVLINLGNVAGKQGAYDEGRAQVTEALRLFREMAIPRGVAIALGSLGGIEYLQSNYPAARSLQTENLEIQCKLGTREGIFLAHKNLALIAIKMGAHSEARGHLQQALDLWRESGREGDAVDVLETYAELAEAHGRTALAVQLYGAAEAARIRLNQPLFPIQRTSRDTVYTRLRASLGEPEFAAAFAIGQQTGLDQAIEQALAEDKSN
jgi:tetratricopeptide (TPR) repeat protein